MKYELMPTVTQSRITLSSDGNLGLRKQRCHPTGRASDSILTVILVPESETKAGLVTGVSEGLKAQ